jgi:hypothetical protein
MNQLYSIGKSFFKNNTNEDEDEGNKSSLDLSNPFSLFQSLDQDGDRKITEDGKKIA